MRTGSCFRRSKRTLLDLCIIVEHVTAIVHACNKTDLRRHSFRALAPYCGEGFSYCVLGVGVRYKLISEISISPDHSVKETVLFQDAFDQTLWSHTDLEDVPGAGIYGRQ